MGPMRAFLVGIGIMALVATSATAAEPRQATATAAPGGATIYFIRGPGIKGFWVPEIDIDDKKIGDLLPATVLTVSRAAGHHTIDIPNHIMSGRSEEHTSELQSLV